MKPKTTTCPECHGLGELPSGDGFDEPCRECGGSGKVYDDELMQTNNIVYDNAKPSYFSEAGVPWFSMWCNAELEYLAWLYVTALSRDGNTWHELGVEQAYELLSVDEESICFFSLANLSQANKARWEKVRAQLTSAAGAFEVGGLGWSKFNYKRKHESTT